MPSKTKSVARRLGGLRTALVAGSILASASACVGSIGGDEDPNGPGPGPEGFEPGPQQMRRLLGRQYLNAVHDLLGAEAAAIAVAPPDDALNGFDAIGAAQRNIGDERVRAYETSARDAASACVDAGQHETYLSCTPTGPTDAECLESFVRKFGRLAFRRTLTDDEAQGLLAVGLLAAEEYGSFDDGLEHVIATVLQAPSFLFQIESGTPVAGAPDVLVLSGTELATRMSFFLLDTTPSESLLDLAETGQLDSRDGVREVALDLMEEEGAREAVRAIYDELLEVRRVVDLQDTAKSPELYPQFNPEIAADMREETLRLVEHVAFDEDTDFREVLTADYTFVTPNLATYYGMDAPTGEGHVRADWPSDQPRAGFLTQGAFLSVASHVELTSPTLRGKFIRERLLCQTINPPPDDVITEFPDSSVAQTMRERLAVHQEVPSCAGCHSVTDPMGLSFENFDAIGRHRLKENGATIDASGTFDDQGDFADGAELASLLADDPRFTSCMVRNVFRHSVGHLESNGERVVLDDLVIDFESSGYRLKDLLVELVASDAFRYVGGEL